MPPGAPACHDQWVEYAVLWIVLGIALAIAEMFTATLLLIMFSAGAFAAAGAAALGAPMLLQVLVFALVSALTIGAIRPVIRRHQRPAVETGDAAFGIEAIEGSTAMVLEQVDSEHGMIKIDGEMWTARSFDDTEVYQPGERVRVIKVKGATALVWREDTPHA
jgi:membrane protein implicated in regulation of membrane protease activity